jgi:hypothetical protein
MTTMASIEEKNRAQIVANQLLLSVQDRGLV